MNAMQVTLRTLRIIQFAMLGSILLYVALGELLASASRSANPSLSYFLMTSAVAVVGVIFVVRRTLVFPSAESLQLHPDDSLTLNHWRSGYIATYALCEILGVFGLVLRIAGCPLQECVPYYVGSFVLLFFFGPRQPVAAA